MIRYYRRKRRYSYVVVFILLKLKSKKKKTRMDEKMLILKSMNGLILTDKLINSWLDANEMFITKKIFSNDRYSVVLIFTDEESKKLRS